MLVVPDSPSQRIMPTRTSSNENFVPTVNGDVQNENADEHPSNNEENNLNGETNKELSRYDQLLLQVESLKLENTTLKKELSNNTSQISKLESQASSLKEMVLMLGNTLKPPSEPREPPESMDPRLSGFMGATNRPNSLFPNTVHTNDMGSYYAQRYQMTRHPMLDMNHTPLSPSPSSTIASEIRRHLNNLHLERTALLESLKHEEITKEGYMRQLNDLSDQLKIMHDSDKTFSPTSENTRLQLESGIREVQEQMEQNLGSPEMMTHRVQDWCLQIDRIELEIKKFHHHLLMLDRPIRTPYSGGESMMPYQKLKLENFSQTIPVSCSFETLSEELLAQDQALSTDASRMQHSRSTQTTQSCRSSLTLTDGTNPDHSVKARSINLLSIQQPIASDDTASMHSFISSLPRQLVGSTSGSKAGEVCSLLGSHDRSDMISTFQRLSLSEDSCNVMRQDGYLPSLLLLLHDGSILPGGTTPVLHELNTRLEIRAKTSKALANIVNSNKDVEMKRSESHVLRCLETIRCASENLFRKMVEQHHSNINSESPQNTATHPLGEMQENNDEVLFALREIIKLVYDKIQRISINELGGFYCVAELLILDCSSKGEESNTEVPPFLLRQSAGLILTNLTYGDNKNKVILMNMRGLLETVRDQLQNTSEEVQQAMASILRNLSCQADKEGRDLLRQKGVVRTLTQCVIAAKREGTLKAMLSALWNLSGHCPENRVDICAVEGALAFLVSTLTYRSPSKSTHVIESGGGILRNVSSIIATTEDYRKILREHNCLQILLQQLTSPSLTIVSNACGTLWNLSARDETDQRKLWELGAASKLQKLIHSKHTVIAQGSAAALRNLFSNRSDKLNTVFQSESKPDMPTLQTRKLRQLEAELQIASRNSSELSENFSPRHHAHNQMSAYSRHSMQESSFLQKPGLHHSVGLHYSGSLGNLPQQTYLPELPFKAWEEPKNGISNPASSPGVFRVPENHFSSHLQFKNNMYATDQNQNLFSNSLPSTRTKSGQNYVNVPKWEYKSAKTWGHNHSVNNNNNEPHWNQNQSGNSEISPSRMPNDLEEKLRYMNDIDDYDQDDLPVNYSLQFPEQSITPGLQSPRTEGNQKKTSACPAKPNHSAANIKSKDTSNQPINVAPGRLKPPAKVDDSVEQRILYADDEIYEAEETPTNFGAIYREEQEDPRFNDPNDNNVMERTKEYKVEDTPVCFTPRSAISDIPFYDESSQQEGENLVKKCDSEYQNENDKTDLLPGAMTPAFSTRGRKSGTMTPKGYQETPLMYSPSSSRSSLDSFEAESVHSQVDSEPSRFCSGVISPSDIPDSPGQSMPVSRSRSFTNLHDAVLKDQQYAQRSVHQSQRNPPEIKGEQSKKTDILQQLSQASDNVRAGYVTSLPQNDEIKCYNTEPAMSDMTTFSGLSVGGDKVAPLGVQSAKGSTSDLVKAGNHAISQAGYVTSLPTPDEIRNYGCEGTLSPMTALSEISALRDHNEGFQPSTSAVSPLKSRTGSYKGSSRSSNIAHLASLPESSRSSGTQASASSGSKSDITEENDSSQRKEDLNELDDLTDSESLGSWSDGEDLLQECIQSAIPKKSASRSSSSKVSSRGKDKSTVRKSNTSKHPVKPVAKKEEPVVKNSPYTVANPPQQPVRKFNITSSLAAAESKLQGMPIIQYIEKKISEAPGLSDEESKIGRSDEDQKNLRGNASASNTLRSDTFDASDLTLTSPDTTLNQSALDTLDAARRAQVCREVIRTVETLNESYSVKKQLKTAEKQKTEDVDTIVPLDNDIADVETKSRLEPLPSVPNHVKVQAFLQSRPKTFATEGTPVEMSRSTSLSNITIDSSNENCDFVALQKRMADKRPDLNPVVAQNATQPDISNQGTSSALNADETDLVNSEDSQSILDNLGKQIKNLTINTGSDPNPRAGYITSLPQSDEIKRFVTEGSISGHTNFSALTIDSDVKIAPRAPVDDPIQTDSPPRQSPTQSKIPVRNPTKLQVVKIERSLEPTEEEKQETSPSQHYGEDLINVVKDKPLNFDVEDTPFHLSGNSSLSSIDIDSDGDGTDLLNACISSAIPTARQSVNSAVGANAQFGQEIMNDHRPSTLQTMPGFHSSNIWEEMSRRNPMNGNQLLSAISPLSLVSLSSPDPTSNSFSITSAGTGTQTNEDYYRLSRQPSVGDSIGSEMSMGSLVLGGDAKSLMKMQNSGRPKISKGKDQEKTLPDDKTPFVKGGKKIYRSPITGKPRENLRYPNKHKDNVSTGSSSARKKDHARNNRNNGRSKSPCNKHHPPHQSRQLPISSSMGRLADTSPGRTYRKNNATSSYSKQMQTGCSANQHSKPSRSRSAHAGYQSSVTQIYPSLKHVNSIMLNGVASMAARGDLVVQQCDGKTAQVIPAPSQLTHVTRPVLIKQGTFVQDEPSPALLQSMSRKPEIPKKPGVKSPPKSGKLKKPAESQQKGKTLWKGLKKLLSPSEEGKNIVSSPTRKPPKKPQVTKGKIVQNITDRVIESEDSSTGFNSGTWTKSKAGSTSSSAQSKPVSRAGGNSGQRSLSTAGSHSSSLSLSSSSASNGSSTSVDVYQQASTRKNIYPTARTMSPSTHIPKSPSAKSRILVSEKSPGGVKSGWRRANDNNFHSRKISMESSSSSAAGNKSHSRRHGSQTSVATSSDKRSLSVASGQGSSARLFYEVGENSTRRNLADGALLFSPPVRRVVQEVAPFNYRPYRIESDVEENHPKSDLSRKQTTV